VTPPVLELTGISKSYGGLRPLRCEKLTVSDGERVALLGFDQAMAEVFVNLVTGATVPERGTVTVLGQPTSAIDDSAQWLSFVDRFGIVSDRAVLLDGLTVLQNLALPFTLDIEPVPPEIRAQAESLAREVGLPDLSWNAPILDLGSTARMLVRVGRSLALNPAVLLLEHPTATVERSDTARFASTIGNIAARRGVAVVALTADRLFADSLGGRTLKLDPASGKLTERHASRWFGRSET
jgi:ABC-type branched-subunit amino acid transport system ATPase component